MRRAWKVTTALGEVFVSALCADNARYLALRCTDESARARASAERAPEHDKEAADGGERVLRCLLFLKGV